MGARAHVQEPDGPLAAGRDGGFEDDRLERSGGSMRRQRGCERSRRNSTSWRARRKTTAARGPAAPHLASEGWASSAALPGVFKVLKPSGCLLSPLQLQPPTAAVAAAAAAPLSPLHLR